MRWEAEGGTAEWSWPRGCLDRGQGTETSWDVVAGTGGASDQMEKESGERKGESSRPAS